MRMFKKIRSAKTPRWYRAGMGVVVAAGTVVLVQNVRLLLERDGDTTAIFLLTSIIGLAVALPMGAAVALIANSSGE